jgi:hypothetical protein
MALPPVPFRYKVAIPAHYGFSCVLQDPLFVYITLTTLFVYDLCNIFFSMLSSVTVGTRIDTMGEFYSLLFTLELKHLLRSPGEKVVSAVYVFRDQINALE